MAVSTSVSAADLLMYVFQETDPAKDMQVSLDGSEPQPLDSNGSVMFRLGGGEHKVEVLQQSELLHAFRFSNAPGYNADIKLAFSEGSETRVQIETFSPRETSVVREAGAKGKISGHVTADGKILANATLSVADSDQYTVTDANGYYEMSLPRGVKTIEVSHPEVGKDTVGNIRVVSFVEKIADLTLNSSSENVVEEVVVSAKFIAEELDDNERFSLNVKDVLDAEALARFGDSDAASAVLRLPGVTVEDGKFVFIRGLEGRYTTTSLNGASLTSTDPTRRVVPLDIFPASILGKVVVEKTYAPNLPGDSTGGHVRLATVNYPAERDGSVSVSIGGNARITEHEDQAYTSGTDGDWDWIGWDDGHRALPGLVKAFDAFNANNVAIPDELLEVMGESFDPAYQPDVQTAHPDYEFEITYGDLRNDDDNEYGYYLAFDYSNKWSVQDAGELYSYESGPSGGLARADEFSFYKTSRNIDISALMSLGASIGVDHQFDSTTIISRKTFDSVRFQNGVDSENDTLTSRKSIEWTEREFISQQFHGSHIVNIGAVEGAEVQWQYTYSQASSDTPDRIEYEYLDINPKDGRLEFSDNSLERAFYELDDKNHDVSTDVSLPFQFDSGALLTVDSGLSVIRRERDFETLRYGFEWSGLDTLEQEITRNRNLNLVLAPENIKPLNGFSLVNNTTPADEYDAEWDIDAVYAMGTLEISNIIVSLGARYEDSTQSVNTANPQNGLREKVVLDQDDILPAFSATWIFVEDMQVRFGASQTVSRPDFKEISRAEYINPETDEREIGNPDLEIAEINNFDLRWEWYINEEDSLTVALFHKDMDKPIEKSQPLVSGTAAGAKTFRNAKEAQLDGVEIDFRKSFILDRAYNHRIFIGLNASLIDSEVKLDAVSAQAEGSSKRELQGQADNILNFQVGYDDFQRSQKVTLLFNRAGERIAEIGAQGLPSIVEEPFNKLDLVYEISPTETFTFKAKAQNILDEAREFTQDGNTYRRYKEGTSFKLSFDWKI